jgi:hypothetical protein
MSLVSYLENYYNYCVPKNGLPFPDPVFLVPDPDTINKLPQNLPVPESCTSIKLDTLRHLIIALKQYEHDFYNDVLNSGSPDFLITSYYSLYLRFLEVLYSRLEVLEQTIPDRDIDAVTKVVNLIVGYFSTPILQYLTRKDVPSNVSDLAGTLLHALVMLDKHNPSGDSFGYYLFSKLHSP